MALTRYRFRVPLKMTFAGTAYREGFLYRGPRGWGEASPLAGYGKGGDDRFHACARELATQGWPSPRVERIPVAGVVGATDPAKAHWLASRCGSSSVKVKVGDPADEARVEAVRDAIGDEGEIRIDANGAWDVATAITKIRAMARYGVSIVEQPVREISDLAHVRSKVDVAVAADECVASVADATELKRREAADVLVIKLQYAGGPAEALRMIEAAGLPTIVSSPVETSVGVAAGAAFAASIAPQPYAHGLGTAALLAFDVVTDRMIPLDGFLPVRVPEVDQDALFDETAI